MTRKIIDTAATCKTDINWVGFADNPAEWLSQQMQLHELKYLLAHADDGVIWGRLDSDGLITSHVVAPEYSPPLRTETLQTARVFAPTGELLIWRDEAGQWVGRLIAEAKSGTKPEWTQAFDEYQILLGTNARPQDRGFTLMSEGSQGLFHVVPLKLEGKIDEQTRPLRLVVRHYLKVDNYDFTLEGANSVRPERAAPDTKIDDYGFVRVNASRLVNLHLEPKESNA
jgi:CRISPR-associated protein (TIGR03984 family)